MKKDLEIATKEFEIAYDYFNNDDYENAYKHFEIAYNNGSIEAIYFLGNMHYYGEGFKEDHKIGNDYFLECANTNKYDNVYVLQAMFNLGNAYYNGDSVKQNIDTAFSWYTKAADYGHCISALNVGIAYFTGEQGLSQNYNNAFKYISIAAEKENDTAQYILGLLYLEGKGTEKNKDLAIQWFKLSASQGNEYAKNALNSLKVNDEDNKDEVSEYAKYFKDVKTIDDPMELKDTINLNIHNLSEYALIDNYDNNLDNYDFSKMSIKEIETHALKGSKEALYLLGKAYFNGDKVKQDYQKAFIYLSRAAILDQPNALYLEGICYINGLGIEKDITRGITCIARSASLNDYDGLNFIVNYYLDSKQNEKALPLLHILADTYNQKEAYVNLGRHYYNVQDYKLAEKYLLKAYDMGEKDDICIKLGTIYFYGILDNADYEKAFKFYKIAADNNNLVGKYNVACMYYLGKGIAQDIEKAKQYAREAASTIKEAKVLLERIEEYESEDDTLNDEDYIVETKGEPKNIPENDKESKRIYNEYSDCEFSEIADLAINNDVVAQLAYGSMLDSNNLHKAAFYWIKKAADNGLVRAINALGYMYDKGHGVEQDNDMAYKYYLISANNGCSVAQRNLGNAYQCGALNLKQDFNKAKEWYELAMKNDDMIATRNLGELYYYPRGIEQDYKKAYDCFTKAIELGDILSKCYLGLLYENGNYVKQNSNKAIELYKDAIENGASYGNYCLGMLYTKDETKDLANAYKYLLKAKESGYKDEQIDYYINEYEKNN